MAVTSWIRRQFRDGVIATATTTMTAVATSFSVGSGQGSSFPDGSIGPFIVTVDQNQAAEEKILVQSRTADTFAVATNGRGYNGTTAQAHTNAVVLHTIDAQDLDEANQTAVQTLGAIQASGDLLQGSGANALQRLARGTTGQFLQAGASLLSWVGFGVGQSTTSAVGDTAADGSQTTPARSDHKHGRESFGVSQSTVSAVGDAAADGTQVTLARSDHKHGREAFATPVAIGSANTAGTATTLPHSDHVHQGVTSVTAGSGISVSGGDGSGHGAITLADAAKPTCRVHRAAAYTLTTGVATTMPFDTSDVDNKSGFSAATGLYTVPEAGDYLVFTTYKVNTTATTAYFNCAILKNGVDTGSDTTNGGNGAATGSAFAMDVVNCAANDTLGVTYGTNTAAGLVNAVMSITKVSV